MIRDLLTVVIWLVVWWRLPTAWQVRWKRLPWVSLTALAVALTIDLTPVTAAIDRVTGIDGLALLAEYLAAVLACAAVLEWGAALTAPPHPRRTRRRHLVTVATVAALAVLFAVMPPPDMADFPGSVNDAATGTYLLVFFGYLAAAMTATAVMLGRAARATTRGTAKAGMILLTAGTAVAAVYAASRIVFLIIRALGGFTTIHATSVMISAGLDAEDAALLLIFAGMSVPALGTGWQSARDLRDLHAFKPLWRSLTSAVPEARIDLPAGARSRPWATRAHG